MSNTPSFPGIAPAVVVPHWQDHEVIRAILDQQTIPEELRITSINQAAASVVESVLSRRSYILTSEPDNALTVHARVSSLAEAPTP